MKMYLTLYSESLKDNADALAEAIRCHALMENDRGDPELLLSQTSDRLLELFLHGHTAVTEAEQYEKKIPPLDGGLRIEEAGSVIEHQCCGDFDDYLNWTDILEEQAMEWTEIWIGHPWIYYRIDGSFIYISDYCEDTPKRAEFRFAFEKNHFLSVLRARVKQAQVFKYRLQQVLKRGDFQNKEVLINRLITV